MIRRMLLKDLIRLYRRERKHGTAEKQLLRLYTEREMEDDQEQWSEIHSPDI